MLNRFRESVNLDSLCNGRLCPRRLHYGLLIVHAWTPNIKNSITADHVAYNFVRLEELEKLAAIGSCNVPGKHLALDTVLRTRGKCFLNWCFDKNPNFIIPSTCLDNEFFLYT